MTRWFWLIAGHNGAGKSTVQPSLATMLGNAVCINPDTLTRSLVNDLFGGQGVDPFLTESNLQAARLVEWALDLHIGQTGSVVVETALSTPKYRPLVERAVAAGMHFGLVYVCLSSADLAIRRVQTRVGRGGHDVPSDKIRDRRQRSLDQMPWFAEKADSALFFCNDDEPRLVARKLGPGQYQIGDDAILPEVTKPLRALSR